MLFQVIGVLLSAVTSQTCQVHEASLLLAIRTCFHIHLISKNQVNKTTAKAALTQMLSVVFSRMESFDARVKMEAEAAIAALVSPPPQGTAALNSNSNR
jgi:brefeldin A-inhibited guanine nucleotide-exchange protein